MGLTQRIFPRMFSPDLLMDFFRHSEYFVVSEKIRNLLEQDPVNIVDRVEQFSLNTIFSCVILAECNLALSSRSTTFLLLMKLRKNKNKVNSSLRVCPKNLVLYHN